MQSSLVTILYIVGFIALFYFVLIRPQNKHRKERMTLLNSLKKGDKVVTIGGMHGLIVELTEERVTLKVNDNSRLTFERSAINSIVHPDGTVSQSPIEEGESEGETKKD